jgi:hypothetical protein
MTEGLTVLTAALSGMASQPPRIRFAGKARFPTKPASRRSGAGRSKGLVDFHRASEWAVEEFHLG